jgi:hypothetical protein
MDTIVRIGSRYYNASMNMPRNRFNIKDQVTEVNPTKVTNILGGNVVIYGDKYGVMTEDNDIELEDLAIYDSLQYIGGVGHNTMWRGYRTIKGNEVETALTNYGIALDDISDIEEAAFGYYLISPRKARTGGRRLYSLNDKYGVGLLNLKLKGYVTGKISPYITGQFKVKTTDGKIVTIKA